MKKRLLSGLLAASMMFSLFPTSAFAAEDQGGGGIDPLTPAAQNAILDEENGEDSAEASAPTEKSYTGIDTQEKLINAVNEINKGSGGTYEIVLSNEIVLTKSLEITNGAKVTIRPEEKIPTTPPEETLPADGNLLTVGKNYDLTLRNITLQGPLTNSSASLLHVLAGATVTLENCTLDGNSVDASGNRIGDCTSNGLWLSDSTVTMENSVIRNCYAENQDGAGALLDGSSTLTVGADSFIQNCVRENSSGNGGGVYVGSTSTLNLQGTISNCKAGAQGGGVYLSSNSAAALVMNGGRISGCTAGSTGGGVYVYYSSTVEMSNRSKIENNCTAKEGGGVYLSGSNAKLEMDNSTISDCTASPGNGGGVYVNGSQASVTMKNGSRIENCTSKSANSSSGGGGVYLYGSNSKLIMDNSTIQNCEHTTTAYSSGGGGVYLYGSDSSLTMNGSSISGCKAPSGGGIYLSGKKAGASMDRSSISDCHATTSYGGGAYLTGQNAALTMSNGSSIASCTAAKNSGGIHISGSDAKLDASSSSITGCTAANGGGVSLAGFRAALSLKEGSAITNCSATQNGGGVYLYDVGGRATSSKLTLEDSSIRNCTAGEGGGVCLDAANAQLLAYNGVITGCTANGGSGGGIYFYGANSDLRRPIQANGAAILTITDCSASGSGGGVFVDSTNGRECSLDFSGCTIYNNKAAVSGSDFYLGPENYDVTLPVVAGKSLTHSTDQKTIDGWYYDPNAEGIRHTLTTPAGRVNTGTSSSTLRLHLNDAPCALVACSAMYGIVFEGAYAADCKAYSDRGCTEEITVASPGDTVYLKYNGSLADDARMSWAAVTDGDDAANRDVSVSDSGRVCASFTMPAVNINSCVTITPAVQTVTYYSIQVNAPEGSPEQAVTVVSSAEEGQTVSLVFDPAALPAGKTFGSWVVKKAGENGEIIPVLSSGSTSTSFLMPASDVVVAFTLNDAGQPDTPDKPSEGGSGDSSGGSSDSGNDDSSGAEAVLAGAVIGAAGYLAGTHVWLAHLYGFIPENRIQLALALWNRADCPEPESTELYPDIDEDDDDAQAAARWCVEQSLMKDYHKTDKEGHEEITFKPCRYVFRLQAIKAWYDLEDLLNEQQAAVDTVSESDFAK